MAKKAKKLGGGGPEGSSRHGNSEPIVVDLETKDVHIKCESSSSASSSTVNVTLNMNVEGGGGWLSKLPKTTRTPTQSREFFTTRTRSSVHGRPPADMNFVGPLTATDSLMFDPVLGGPGDSFDDDPLTVFLRTIKNRNKRTRVWNAIVNAGY